MVRKDRGLITLVWVSHADSESPNEEQKGAPLSLRDTIGLNVDAGKRTLRNREECATHIYELQLKERTECATRLLLMEEVAARRK